MDDWIEQLSELRRLKDTQAIDEAEFERRRAAIIAERDASRLNRSVRQPLPRQLQAGATDAPVFEAGPESGTTLSRPAETATLETGAVVAEDSVAVAPEPRIAVSDTAAAPAAPVQPTTTASRLWGRPAVVVGGGLTLVAALIVVGAVIVLNRPSSPPYPISTYDHPRQGHVLSGRLNVRSGPGASFKTVGEAGLADGDAVTALGETTSSDGGRWLYVHRQGGDPGYVNARLVALDDGSSGNGAQNSEVSNPTLAAATSPAAATSTAPTPPTTFDVPTPSQPSGDLQRMINDYFASWSNPGDRDGNGIGRYYGDRVNFYGGEITRSALMAQKLIFARRWPERNYETQPGSVSVKCLQVSTCTIKGIVEWRASDDANSRSASGRASFAFDIRNGLIVAETGRVLKRE